MAKKIRDYYKEIDTILIAYEQNGYHPCYSTDYICNRIDWCWKWRKITRGQMEELADRIIAVINADTEMLKRSAKI